MAKLTAPLLSFGARGKLADTLVYFPWKGIHAVRSYVIPANPNSGAQQTQRGYLTTIVALWHTAALDADDKTAWNRAASVLSSPMSGFNAFMRYFIDRLVAGVTANLPTNGTAVDNGAGSVDVDVDDSAPNATTASVSWGYSPSSLINTTALALAANVWSATLAVAPNSKLYYRFNFFAAGPTPSGQSGIYTLDVGP